MEIPQAEKRTKRIVENVGPKVVHVLVDVLAAVKLKPRRSNVRVSNTKIAPTVLLAIFGSKSVQILLHSFYSDFSVPGT